MQLTEFQNAFLTHLSTTLYVIQHFEMQPMFPLSHLNKRALAHIYIRLKIKASRETTAAQVGHLHLYIGNVQM